MTLLDEIVRITDAGSGTYGVAASNLATDEAVELRAHETFNTASVIKVPIMVELYLRAHEGGLSLGERMELTGEHHVGGSGLLQEFEAGLRPTLRDLCVAMIVVSDNVATNMLIARLGLDAVNECCRALGLARTRLNRPISFDPVAAGQPQELGVTTPAEMLQLFEGLARGVVVSPEASAEMVRILARQHYRNLIPRLLPDDYDAVTGESEPQIANKTGAVNGVRNDVALLTFKDGRQWVISAFSKDLADLTWSVDNTGMKTIARVARAIYDAWS